MVDVPGLVQRERHFPVLSTGPMEFLSHLTAHGTGMADKANRQETMKTLHTIFTFGGT